MGLIFQVSSAPTTVGQLKEDETKKKQNERDLQLREQRAQNAAALAVKRSPPADAAAVIRSPVVRDLTEEQWQSTGLPYYSPDKFKNRTRISPDLFQLLYRILYKTLNARREASAHPDIPVPRRMGIALYFMAAKNCSASMVGDIFTEEKQTVKDLLLEFCEAVTDTMANKYIAFPNTKEKKEAMAKEFSKKLYFPNTFGALDVTQIPITAPLRII